MKRLPLYILLLSYGMVFTQGTDTPPPPPPNGVPTTFPEDPALPIDTHLIFLLLAGLVLGWYYLRNRNKLPS